MFTWWMIDGLVSLQNLNNLNLISNRNHVNEYENLNLNLYCFLSLFLSLFHRVLFLEEDNPFLFRDATNISRRADRGFHYQLAVLGPASIPDASEGNSQE